MSIRCLPNAEIYYFPSQFKKSFSNYFNILSTATVVTKQQRFTRWYD